MSLVPTVHQVYPGSNGTLISGVPVNANGGFIGKNNVYLCVCIIVLC